jgi:hypothetical protein
LGLLVGLLTEVTPAHAFLNSGPSLCAPYGTTGFGDLDFALLSGELGVKANSNSKQVVCALPRQNVGFVSDKTFFVDGFNSAGLRVSVTLVATGSHGEFLGMFASSFPPTTDGMFDMPFNVPGAAMPDFGYMSAFMTIPGNNKCNILGFFIPS